MSCRERDPDFRHELVESDRGRSCPMAAVFGPIPSPKRSGLRSGVMSPEQSRLEKEARAESDRAAGREPEALARFRRYLDAANCEAVHMSGPDSMLLSVRSCRTVRLNGFQ